MLLTTSKNPTYAYFRKVSVLPILAAAMALFSIQVNAQEKKPKKQKGMTYMVTMQADSTTFSDPKTGKKAFSVATKDMPPPPAPVSLSSPPTPPTPPNVLIIENTTTNQATEKEAYRFKVDNNEIIIKKVEDNPTRNSQIEFKSVPTGKAKPLIVINGKITVDLDLNEINPNTIESINVLKGEKAIEKYAEKGTNGVVEITTKKP